MDGGTVTLGRHTHDIYGWDNEFGETVYDVASFRASKYLVSNEEFIGFIEAGGYKQNGWWSEKVVRGVTIIMRICLNFGGVKQGHTV